MAPKATGTKSLDQELIVELAYSALKFAIQHSAPDASFLCKVWDLSVFNIFVFVVVVVLP